jgi:hypothetical protein
MRLPLSRDVIRRVFGRLVFFTEVILEKLLSPSPFCKFAVLYKYVE